MSAAASLLRRASALLEDGAERAALLVDLGEALTELGSFDDADRPHTAAEAASKAGDGRLGAKAELARLATTLYLGAGRRLGSACR